MIINILYIKQSSQTTRGLRELNISCSYDKIMMWKIYKDDGQDLSFAISCLYYDAINMNEFNQWIEEVIRTTKIEP